MFSTQHQLMVTDADKISTSISVWFFRPNVLWRERASLRHCGSGAPFFLPASLPFPACLALKKVPHGNKELSQRTGVFSTYVSTCLRRNPARQGDRQTHTQTGSNGGGRMPHTSSGESGGA